MAEQNTGKITQIIGAVMDIKFSQGKIPEINEAIRVPLEDGGSLTVILQANGWTWQRAVSMLLFTLLHWPCSTTLLTIRRETGSRKWTALAFLLPTVLGIALCCLFTAVFGT